MWSRSREGECSSRAVRSPQSFQSVFLEWPFFVLPLPPCFCLHSVGQPIGSILKRVGSILKRDPAHKASQAIRPVRVSEKRTQHWPAEEFSARTDLRCNGKFPQPTVELPGAAMSVIKSSLKCE